MRFEEKRNYHGFRLEKQKKIKEINSMGRVFYHEKSGAHLLYLENDDDNKVFSISFRTPPKDSTGIPHIIEHSVLNGSRKFPSKEPFVELAKGSLSTFLNAITFPDKTMYPVASRNEKDFYNLMDVYLDAVFYPNIYRYPEIFMQEGWHYELENTADQLNYKGVVYNEMKGLFSSPEALLFRKIPESLFPDTPYGFESGGDPDVLPQLTLDQFLSFHREFYHPSNSYIFFYGNGKIIEHLKFLHDSYLKDFDRIEVDSKIGVQDPFTHQRDVTAWYPILPHEEEVDKTFFSLNFVVGRSTDPEMYMAFNMLEYLLLETPAAPLKKELMDKKIGKDVFGQYERDMLQPVFSVVVKNSNEEQKESLQEVVFQTLERLVRTGIDKKLIEAAINIHEFKLREADFGGLPKGLVYLMGVMGSWLYDADPFLHLEYERTLKTVKKALSTDYFEQLIQKHLLNNTHRSLLAVKPKKGLAEERSKKLQDELASYRDRLSDSEINSLIKETAELKKRQITPDPREKLEKIPLLTLSDIDPEGEKLPLEESEEEGICVLSHPLFTNRITYLNLLFDTTGVPQEDLPYITLLSRVLGKVSTGRYHYSDLSNYINIHTGGIQFNAETFIEKDNDSLYFPRLVVKSKSLVQKLPELSNILGEIIGNTRYDERKRLREIIQETKSRFEMGIYDYGHFITSGRLLSYFSQSGGYAEQLGGVSFFHFITGLERDFDKRFDEIFHKLRGIARLVFNRSNLLVSVTTAAGDYKSFHTNLPRVLEPMGESRNSRNGYRFDLSLKNEGLLTPGKVQYVAKGFNFKHLGFDYSGDLQVLRTVASLDYLWNRVRVQGGAYGTFARFARNGNMYFCSYRDPNLKETLQVYNEAADYFRVFDANEREITKYIIGTISRLDHPLTPSMKGEVATERYIRNITHDDVQKTREEILHTGTRDIKRSADLIGEAMRRDFHCVLGNEGKIKDHREMFTTLVDVF